MTPVMTTCPSSILLLKICRRGWPLLVVRPHFPAIYKPSLGTLSLTTLACRATPESSHVYGGGCRANVHLIEAAIARASGGLAGPTRRCTLRRWVGIWVRTLSSPRMDEALPPF
jgi:hypothetical protein